MWITTGVEALASPLNEGVRSLDGVAGWFSVTTGECVSTVNVAAHRFSCFSINPH